MTEYRDIFFNQCKPMPIHAMHRWEIDIHIDGKIIDISDRDSDSDITQKPSSAFSFLG